MRRMSWLMVGAALVSLMGASQAVAQTYNSSAAFTGQTSLERRHRACVWAQPKGGDYGSIVDSDVVSGNAQACIQAVSLFDASGGVLGTAPGSSSTGTSGMLAEGLVTTSSPAYTTGTINGLSLDTSGNLRSALYFGTIASTGAATNAALATSANASALRAVVFNYSYDGSQWVQGGGAPSSSTAAGIAQAATSAVASALVLKGSAGNLYSVDITTGASAGYLMVFNATSAPADGTVTPLICTPVAANTGIRYTATPPAVFSTGITAVFSTTGCFTKTASATAFIAGQAK